MTQRGLSAVVLQHVPFEDLGSLRPVLEQRGFAIEFADAATATFPLPQTQVCDLLVVLGGPIGVYESEAYPFLTSEIDCIRMRLDAQKPTLGICLGAQLIAAAAGARVYPGGRGPEIGWAPIRYSAPGEPPSWFAPLLQPGINVLHWHSDTFDLPPDATRLASTDLYDNQAFTLGDFALALQFHPEVTSEGLERWYVGHAYELAKRHVSVPELRAATETHAPVLANAAQLFWNHWLDYIL
jgi:GMP synthase (glutamine-hydrolysing)